MTHGTRETVIDVATLRPHSEEQRLMVESRDSVVALCGRRFGKTDAYVQRLLYQASARPGLYWWVGLSWQSASMRRAWRRFYTYARQVYQILGLRERDFVNKSAKTIAIPGLIDLWFRTAENPAALAGEGILGAVVDEFTLMDESVWVEYLEATLLDYGGWAAFAGVPKGNNWGAKLWRQARSRDGWRAIQASTFANPYIDRRRLEEIRDNTHELYWRQEYLAEIVDDAGEVFSNIVDLATATRLSSGVYGARYVYGVDWGKSGDYTVVSVFDMQSSNVATQVELERWRGLDYDMQLKKLLSITRRFPPYVVVVETNAMGEPLADFLSNDYDLPIRRVFVDNRTKLLMIDALVLATERRDIRLIADAQLVNEFQALERVRTRTGRYTTYQAAPGEHDDVVMSVALAYSALTSGGSGVIGYAR